MASDVHFDFSAALLIFSVVTGLIWFIDARWLAPRRNGQKLDADSGQPKDPWLVDFSKSFFPVIFAVLLLRSFVVEPFRIPSGSMIPTLHIGDFILVNKFSYGLRMPVFHQKFLSVDEPKRGDVAVFRFPEDPSKDFIKRVIGLPGDEIGYRGKRLYVNRQPVELSPIGDYRGAGVRPELQAKQLAEDLGGLKHDVLIYPVVPAQPFRVTVPEGHYFMMGDNRDGSDDSRRWGFVPERNLVGKAFYVWMSWDSEAGGPAWNRIGDTIQ